MHFSTECWSIVNLSVTLPNGKNPHCHTSTRNTAERIVDAYWALCYYNGKRCKYDRYVRSKAMALKNRFIEFS